MKRTLLLLAAIVAVSITSTLTFAQEPGANNCQTCYFNFCYVVSQGAAGWCMCDHIYDGGTFVCHTFGNDCNGGTSACKSGASVKEVSASTIASYPWLSNIGIDAEIGKVAPEVGQYLRFEQIYELSHGVGSGAAHRGAKGEKGILVRISLVADGVQEFRFYLDEHGQYPTWETAMKAKPEPDYTLTFMADRWTLKGLAQSEGEVKPYIEAGQCKKK